MIYTSVTLKLLVISGHDSNEKLWHTELVYQVITHTANGEISAQDLLRPGGILRQGAATCLGFTDPVAQSRDLDMLYRDLVDHKVGSFSKRADNAISRLVRMNYRQDYLAMLPIGLAAPLREAARACQLVPPLQWPLVAYELVGRNDISEGALMTSDSVFNDGYRTLKEHLVRLAQHGTSCDSISSV